MLNALGVEAEVSYQFCEMPNRSSTNASIQEHDRVEKTQLLQFATDRLFSAQRPSVQRVEKLQESIARYSKMFEGLDPKQCMG